MPGHAPLQRRIIVLGVIAALIAGTVFLYFMALRPVQHGVLTLWTATQNDVEVRIAVRRDASGQLSLAGTFTPVREHFYLYSKDLPRDGLDGLGRPTLLEVIDSGSIQLTGPLEADQPIQNIYIKILDLSFPVYPVGPVTLSLPIEVVGNDRPVSMEISITYMACSEKVCLPPVVDKHIPIQVPDSFWAD